MLHGTVGFLIFMILLRNFGLSFLMERLNPEYPTYKDLLQCGLVNEIRNAGFRITRTDTTFWDFFQLVQAER
jgi:hypothetical protein